jgi:hypothetical protein
MTTQTKSDTTMTGRLKRLADDILSLHKPDSDSAATMPIAEPTRGLGGVEAVVDSQGSQTPKSGGSGFVPFRSYPLAVAVKEASRGYGKAARAGNKNLIYVFVDGWEGQAVCRVTDREQWKPHDRLEGVFSRITEDNIAEFAYLPGRRAGRGR